MSMLISGSHPADGSTPMCLPLQATPSTGRVTSTLFSPGMSPIELAEKSCSLHSFRGLSILRLVRKHLHTKTVVSLGSNKMLSYVYMTMKQFPQ